MKIGYLMQEGAADLMNQPFGGPSVHVRQVCNELGNLGHEVRLLARFGRQLYKSVDSNLMPVYARHFDGGPIRVFEKAVRRTQYELHLPYVGVFESLRFAAACRQELGDCDLFYERMGWMGYGGALAARQLRIPLIFEVNGDHLSEMQTLGLSPTGVQQAISLGLMGKAIKMASHVVVSGEGWRHQFINRWKIDPAKVTVVENGTELVSLLKRDQLCSFASSTNQESDITLVYVGGFQPWQGLPILIAAISRAVGRGLPLRLLLIGSGPEQEAITRLIQELNLGGRVVQLGHLAPSQYRDCLATADIGVAPYCGWAEYSGLKLFDYKAAGLATIVSGEGGKPTVIEHGRTGLIVPPCDENALCDAITLLGRDPQLRRQMGREARIEAEKLHSWSNTAAQLTELFNHLERKAA